MLTKISQIVEKAKQASVKPRLVLANADNEHALEAVIYAKNEGLIIPILVGDEAKIRRRAEEAGLDLEGIEIKHQTDIAAIVKTSVGLISSREGDILMKGRLQTSEIMKGVLNKEWGMRTSRLLSHFAIFEIPIYHKLLVLTDVAMNIAPTLAEKAQIIGNTVDFCRNLGIEEPKVAAVAAVENVNEKMPATIDAALLTLMNRRGQIRNCIVDGPLSFDLAISAESKEEKGIESPVAADADIILAPDIEAANLLYKSFGFFIQAEMAAVILGASAPIVLTSRADSREAKYNSIALAVAGLGDH